MLYKLELSAIHLDLWRITLCSHARRHRSKMFVPIEILSHECRETCPLGLNNTTPFQEGYDFIRRGTKLKYFPDALEYTPTSIHCHCPNMARTRSTFVLCSNTCMSSTLLAITLPLYSEYATTSMIGAIDTTGWTACHTWRFLSFFYRGSYM